MIEQVINEINELWERQPKGRDFDQDRWLGERIKLLARYGYTDRTWGQAIQRWKAGINPPVAVTA